jgi:hypothetical protein
MSCAFLPRYAVFSQKAGKRFFVFNLKIALVKIALVPGTAFS